MKATIKNLLLLGILISGLAACDNNRVMDENHEIPSSVWTLENLQHFQFQVSDTSRRYNFAVNVRNTNEYAYSNLYLFLEITGPDERTFRDTLEIRLADNTGKWLGSGIGNVWQNQVPFLKGVPLNQPGTYQVIIGHGMRDNELEGIADVGFRVEKSL